VHGTVCHNNPPYIMGGSSRQFSVAETLATNLVVAAICCVWFKYGQGVCTGPAAPLGRPTARRTADCTTCAAMPCVGAHGRAATLPSAEKSGAHDDGYAHVDTITEAFTRTGTDKLWRHGYHRHYENWLLPYKNKAAFDMLEIGTKDGQSLVSWMLYFNNIRHIDAMRYGEPGKWNCKKAAPKMRVDCDKIHIFEGDQSAKADLQTMKDARPEGWDIIIDDGSHVPLHNIISFKLLWNSIKVGGMYVVEDIESSWMDGKVYGYRTRGGLPPKKAPASAVEFFKLLVDVVNRKHFLEPGYTMIAGDEHIAEIVFGDGLLMVRKYTDLSAHQKYPQKVVVRQMWGKSRVFDDKAALAAYKETHAWLDTIEDAPPAERVKK